MGALGKKLDLLNGFIAGCNVKMINLARMLVGFFVCFRQKSGVNIQRHQKTD